MAACSGAGASSSTTAGTAADAAGFKTAAAKVATYRKVPTSIGITQPIGKPIPSNKTVVLIGAGQGGSGTILTYNGFKDAAKLMGWNVKEIQPQQPTPQLLQQALNQASQLNPDLLVISAVDVAPIETQLKEFQSKGVPIVSTTGADPTGGVLTLQLMGVDGLSKLAQAVGDKSLADMGAPGTVGMVGIQGYKIINDYSKSYKSEVNKLCPSCQVKSMELPLTSLGTTAGSDIVNWLRANPDIKSLFVGWDGMDANLFSAAKQAGVTLPKTYSVALVPENLTTLSAGTLTASTPMDTTELGWRLADAAARIFTDQTASALDQDVKYERAVLWDKEYGNIPQSAPSDGSYPPVVANYQDQYKKIWDK
ncbi:sugar ABC transporter substrate-binding protein [Diaminobutyricibacter sp. McL0618]|uniref:sugar ABC transporter substrate-binding protein n=1 Tax=Leifsonia sp. McL0618 TaxID=3415677 RepID=UPI003CF1263D